MSALRLRCVDLLVTICLAAFPTSGCGGTKSSGGNGSGTSTDTSAGGTSGSDTSAGGASGSNTSTGGTTSSNADASPSTGGAPAGSVPCGTKTCLPPEGSTETACCQDQFQGICGVVNRSGCVNAPKPPPQGCPKLPSAMGFMGTPCCTAMGQCGIQQRGLGQQCVDVATAAAQASKMGVNVGQVPPPTSCTPADGGA
ncbi:MAG TPA: hypothetical protein VHC69_10245 [Polyangiaceae bacterium]|nr:hypothetical protein [Polyangiaceae bacterium]